MGLNEGLIYTNSNCIGCSSCLSGCPVLGANVSVKRGGAKRIYVDGDSCIRCGKCTQICQHGAREYRDDTLRLLDDLRAGERISVLVDPAFFALREADREPMLTKLKALGVSRFYDISFGADIAVWAYTEYLAEHPAKGNIAPHCQAAMNYIQKYSRVLTEKLIPVYSPTLCLAVYIRNYAKLPDRLAVLSPCIAKKDEIERPGCEGLVQYSVTFEHLCGALSDISEMKEAEFEPTECGMGRSLPFPGGLGMNMRRFFPTERTIREIHGVGYVYDYIGSLERKVLKSGMLPDLIDCMSCSFGCLNGFGMPEHDGESEDDYFIRMQEDMETGPLMSREENPYLLELPPEERRRRLEKRFSQLDPADFVCSMEWEENRICDSFEKMREADEARIDTIFREMYKNTEASRSINCHSCGYRSCREMAIAIARGYNSRENCIYYLKDQGMQMAMKDPRYGIANTNAFGVFLDELVAKGQQEAYVCLQFNLQHFSRINQNYGYQQGDVIMKLYCNMVSAMARQGEMVALMGGNSFLAAFRVERLEWAIKQLTGGVRVPFFPGDEISLTARVAVYWPQMQDISSPMIMERLAMTYNLLQRNSKEQVIYYDGCLRRQIEAEEQIYEMIEPAIRGREFEVYYQPKVNMVTRRLTGAEALIRWNHRGKMILPSEFVPVCEKRGLIEKLDFFVLESVCESIRDWVERGIKLVPISVNFSKQHFVNRNVSDQINDVAHRYGVPREYLEVEFTETAYMEDSDGLIYSINRLHEYGFAASMDDFGTGYSSLSMLQDMSFDTLKLDKSFLDDQRYTQQRGRAVIENIIRMAKQLNMTIVSEGIETEAELKFMQSMGCDAAQGYLFDRPLRRSEFEERLKKEFY